MHPQSEMIMEFNHLLPFTTPNNQHHTMISIRQTNYNHHPQLLVTLQTLHRHHPVTRIPVTITTCWLKRNQKRRRKNKIQILDNQVFQFMKIVLMTFLRLLLVVVLNFSQLLVLLAVKDTKDVIEPFLLVPVVLQRILNVNIEHQKRREELCKAMITFKYLPP